MEPCSEGTGRRGRAGSRAHDRGPDLQAILGALPGDLVVLDRAFRIVAARDAYLTRRSELVRRNVFDASPNNPDDPAADGVRKLRRSLERLNVPVRDGLRTPAEESSATFGLRRQLQAAHSTTSDRWVHPS